MTKVDGFAVKIASFNALAFFSTATAVTYVDGRLTTHVAFGARHYPHGYQVALLGGLFIFATTLLALAAVSAWHVKSALPATILALAGALSLPFFRPEFPHGGISIWTFAFSLISLFTCFVHFLPSRTDPLTTAAVSAATKLRRAKESAALWRKVTTRVTVGYIAVLIPWATFIWFQSPHIVTDNGEAFLLSEFGAAGIVGSTLYMLLGVIYESFCKSREAADFVLHGTAPQARAETESPPPAPKTLRNQVFISYSRKDRVWLDRLQTMLKPLVRSGAISVWAETSIQPGSLWREELQRALASANVAVFLVSDTFLASDFIAQEEMLPLLAAAKKGEVQIFWLYLSHCLFEASPIADYQAAHDLTHPLAELPRAAQDRVLRDVAEAIQQAVRSARQPTAPGIISKAP